MALEGISFELYPARSSRWRGTKGKSTLKNLLAGVVRPDEGQITVNGETVTDAA